MKLGAKLLAAVSLAMLLAGGVSILLSRRVVNAELIHEVAQRGRLKTEELAAVSAAAFHQRDEAALLTLLHSAQTRAGAVYAIALATSGEVLAHTNVLEKGRVYQDPLTMQALGAQASQIQQTVFNDELVLDVSLPVWSVSELEAGEDLLLFGSDQSAGATRVGTLRLGLPLSGTLDTADAIAAQVAGAVIASGVLGLSVTFVFLRRIVRPIHHLVEGTRQIRQGQYGSSVPILSRDELGELAVSFNDMSREMAAVHRNLADQVKARTQELESFVYTVSHDLKSPVVSIQGLASIFLEDNGRLLSQEARHDVDRIIANANFMEELISGLLTLSRIGRSHQQVELADAGDIIREVIENNQDRIRSTGVEVVVHAPLPPFRYDRIQLLQLFQNLISNAIKFSGHQKPPRVEVGGRQTADRVEFYVRDNGIGIDPAFHERIFGVFQRLKDVEVEGTGIGLSIVRKIMDLAGGRVRLESAKLQGATFFLEFPICSAPYANEAAEPKASNARRTAARGE